VVGIDLDGDEVVLEGRDLAQALQHETDHLDGMLYLSRLPRRKIAMRASASSWF
jgi:peptide deformylase